MTWTDWACWRCMKRPVVNPGDHCIVCDDFLNVDRSAKSVKDLPMPAPADMDKLAYERWQQLTGN